MLNTKEIEILNCLFKQRGAYVKSGDIAEYIGVSDRTVRKYAKQLQEQISPKGAALDIKQGQGYRLIVDDDEAFGKFMGDAGHSHDMVPERSNESQGRQYEMLKILLFDRQWETVESFADHFFVSRSTLTNDAQQMRRKLEKYNLRLVSRAHRGIGIEGLEVDKRHFIMDYFLGQDFFSSMNSYFSPFLELDAVKLEELAIIVLDETREGQVHLSDYLIQNLVIHLALSMRRIMDGHVMKEALVTAEPLPDGALLIADRIIQRVERAFDVKFPIQERQYIGLHITSKGAKHETTDHQEAERPNVVKTLRTMEESIGIPLADDRQLIEGILTHLGPLRVRLKNKIGIVNPLLHDISETHVTELELTKMHFSNMEGLSEFEVSDHEWAYITLHILAALQRHEEHQKLDVLVICATGYGSSQMLKVRLEREFGNDIRIRDVIGYYDINNQQLDGIDLIVSSIDLSNVMFRSPVIKVGVLLKEPDIIAVDAFIARHRARTGNMMLHQSRRTHTLLDALFDEKRFFFLEGDVDRQDIDHLLIESLGDGSDEFHVQFKENLDIREHLSSVVFTDTVAVPHPVAPLAERSAISVAVIPAGLKWDDTHDAIKIVFMLSPSVFEGEAMKRMIRLLVDLIEDEKWTGQLMDCKDFGRFRRVMLSHLENMEE